MGAKKTAKKQDGPNRGSLFTNGYDTTTLVPPKLLRTPPAPHAFKKEQHEQRKNMIIMGHYTCSPLLICPLLTTKPMQQNNYSPFSPLKPLHHLVSCLLAHLFLGQKHTRGGILGFCTKNGTLVIILIIGLL